MSASTVVLLPAHEQVALVRAGDVGAEELLDLHLDRIRALNPELNAIVTLDELGARSAARRADAMVAEGAELGPLHGLPMTVKDALAVADLRCTGGAIELTDNVSSRDADVVARVRSAGAVILGKTNLPRWSADVQASNEIFGTTLNPWDPTRGPGGSSGGASAAVASAMSALDIGTDIGGSIRLPAHFAGICGHKPSFGVVSALGYVDHLTAGRTEPDVNVVGPLGRTVDDVSLLFDVIAGPSPDRATGWDLSLPPPRATGLADLRIAAWLDDPGCPVGSEVARVLAQTVRSLREAGAHIDERSRPDVEFESVRDIGLPLISAATSPGRSDEEYAALEAIANHPPVGTPDSMVRRARSSTLSHRDWALLTERREDVRAAWATFFTDVDVLLCPVAVIPAFPHQLDGSLYDRTIDVDGEQRPYTDLITWTSFIGFAYLPSTVVPVGLTEGGLPVGIQVVGPFLEDRTTLAAARAIEAVTGGWQVPPVGT